MTALVLSLFPGIGLLDMPFEEEGYCVVRGPDVLWGGDVRRFHPPAGVFEGVIGGPPCQSFSGMAALNRAAHGVEPIFGNLIPEYERVVRAARPCWFVMENVPQAPEPVVDGYAVHSIVLNNRWVAEAPAQNRVRRFSFGTHDGARLAVEVALFESPTYVSAVVGGHPSGEKAKRRSVAWGTIADMCLHQGLPDDYLAHTPFTGDGARRAIANGVPLPMGRAIARAVRRAVQREGVAS